MNQSDNIQFQSLQPFGEENKIPASRGEGFDLVQETRTKFDKYLDYYQNTIDRENEAWRMYHGLNHGQWSDEAISKLASENRRIPQFNFIRKKIDILASSILRNIMDVDFVPIDGEASTLTEVLKTIYYSDKEMMDWDVSYREFLRDFLIFSGTEELTIDKRYSELGNIGFTRIMPTHILFDPFWRTTNGWDLKEAMKVSYMTPTEIKDLYNIKDGLIDVQVEMLKRNGPDFETTDYDAADIPHIDHNDVYGSEFKVIERHWIKPETVEVEYGFDTTGRIIQIPEGSNEKVLQELQTMGFDPTSGTFKKKHNVNKYYVTTVCPNLLIDKPLQHKLAYIQIGRLPFFHASSQRVNGTDCGMVEVLKDVQETINKRESLIDQMIANSAAGAKIIDPELFGNDYTMLEEVKANFNNPTYTAFSKPGEIASGRRHIEELPRTQFPSDVVNELQRMHGLSDSLSYTSANSEGRSEGSEDRAGSIYTRKLQQSEINLTYITKILEHHTNEKGEAYMLVAQQHYAGVYREFKLPSKDKTVAINDEINTPIGPITLNDITKIPRHKIIVSQSPQGVTYREVQRSINAQLLQSIPPTNPIARAIAVKNILSSLDNSEQEKLEYNSASELEMQLAMENTKAQILGLKMQQVQAEMQMQQMMNPQPQQPQQPQMQQGQPPMPPENEENEPQETPQEEQQEQLPPQ